MLAPVARAKQEREQLPLSPSPKYGRHCQIQGDRFIPSRSAMDFEVAHFSIFREANENNSSILNVTSPVKEEYKRKLAENLLHDAGSPDSAKILAFKKKPGLAIEGAEHRIQIPFAEDFTEISSYSRKYFRHIPQSPERILDAPELVDDYYLNLLDWSSKNVVAVALGSIVYLWDADTSAITQLMQTSEGDDYVTSVSWAGDGKYIAVGLNCSEIQIWDACKRSQVRKLAGHSARVGSLAWNGSVLSSGGRDTRIINHDVRIPDHITSTLRGHNQEVCGLKWSPSGQHLASGGNDNLLHVWEMGSQRHVHRWDEHQAAVKALSWCPFQANLLASGGGTADRCIKLWNTQTGICISSLDTLSQVCSLLWSKNQKEILSSHGYSQNQLCLWRYPSMVKIAELTGHNSRVLHLAQSPDGSTVVSAAADETLRFWKIFGSSSTTVTKTATSANSSSNPSSKVGACGALSMRGIR